MTNATGCEARDGDLSGVGVAHDGHAHDGRDRSAGVLGSIADLVRSGARLLADFIDRIVQGIRIIAPLVLGIGCESTSDVAKVELPAMVAPAPTPVKERDAAEPRQLGRFTITFYNVVGEDEVAAKTRRGPANDNRSGDESGDDTRLTAITRDLVTLYAGGGGCEPIAEVSKEFSSQLRLQGTGKLRDGRIVNIWGACPCEHSPCFKVTKAQWGMAGNGRPLEPFRTIAVDPRVVKLGSLLHIPLLEGRTMPGRQPWGGYVHDGCVVADDTGGNIKGNRIDLFVGRKAYFLGLSGSGGRHAWARHVPVFDGSGICERKGRQVGRKAASI